VRGAADNAGLMQGKRVLLGVTGGIAAYKSPDLVRRLREQGADVQVVLTSGAHLKDEEAKTEIVPEMVA